MKRPVIPLLMIALFGMSLTTPTPAQETAGTVARWDFEVYLDDKKVGTHVFEVTDIGGMRRVHSEASFKYKILFIPAYRYEHTNSERWIDDCLVQFDAKTNINGKRVRASGRKNASGFAVAGKNGLVELPECVMSFAYWNPAFLEQQRLLNPQSGEYLDVSVEEPQREILEVRGRSVSANRYRITADKVNLTVWYSDDDEWLALESAAKGGRVIRYELS